MDPDDRTLGSQMVVDEVFWQADRRRVIAAGLKSKEIRRRARSWERTVGKQWQVDAEEAREKDAIPLSRPAKYVFSCGQCGGEVRVEAGAPLPGMRISRPVLTLLCCGRPMGLLTMNGLSIWGVPEVRSTR